MAIDFHVWSKGQFTKRKNSTKRPSDTGTIINCYLKDSCGVLNPVIVYQPTSTDQNPSDWNYAYIGSFDRYYFVDDWEYNAGLWYGYLSVDTLATYKTEIGNSTQYIVRSAYLSDTNIVDTLYPMKTTPERVVTTIPAIWESPGITVLGISAQANTTSLGGINYYVFTAEQLQNFWNNVYSSTSKEWWNIVDTVTYDPLVFNPLDFVKTAHIIPFNTSLGTTVDTIDFGYWKVPGSARKLSTSTVLSVLRSVTLENHPQITRGQYLNSSPYTNHLLVLEPFGSFPVDGGALYNNSLSVQVSVDIASGQGIMDIMSGGNTLVHTSTQVAIPTLLNIQTTSVSTVSQGILDTVKNAFNYSADLKTIGSALGAPLVRETGSAGSFITMSATYAKHNISSLYYKVADDYPADRGKPLCKPKQISSAPGYIETAHTELSISCLSSEYDTIINYMEGGFFYE